MNHSLTVQSCFLFAWKTFKARPWLFVGSSLIYAVVQLILGTIEHKLPGLVSALISLVAGTLLALGLMSLYLKAHDDVRSATFSLLWNPKPFWQYLATSIVMGIIVVVGLLLLIVPGVILALAFSFAPYIVIERKVWPMEALKESWRLTKGHWLKLFLLALTITALNIVGAMVLLVGLLVTAPLSILAMVHAYRTLSGHTSSEVASAPETEPATPMMEPQAPAAEAVA